MALDLRRHSLRAPRGRRAALIVMLILVVAVVAFWSHARPTAATADPRMLVALTELSQRLAALQDAVAHLHATATTAPAATQDLAQPADADALARVVDLERRLARLTAYATTVERSLVRSTP